MILKERSKSVSHRVLDSLNYRMALSHAEKMQYENVIKGFNGELAFDRILNESAISGLIINDLLLSARDTFYQIDSLLITDETIYLYEVKNYRGTYVYKDNSLYASSGHAVQDPVAQADRKRAYLHNLLLKLPFFPPKFLFLTLSLSLNCCNCYYTSYIFCRASS